jgi:hypothetical protein
MPYQRKWWRHLAKAAINSKYCRDNNTTSQAGEVSTNLLVSNKSWSHHPVQNDFQNLNTEYDYLLLMLCQQEVFSRKRYLQRSASSLIQFAVILQMETDVHPHKNHN